MTHNSKIIIAAVVALLAIGAGVYTRIHSQAEADAAVVFPAQQTFKDLSGQTHALGEWHGKILLLNFWASWCGPCLQEMPSLIEAQKKYGPRGFQVVGAAADDEAAARAEAEKLGVNYPVLVGTPDQIIALMTALGDDQGGLPFSVFVGPDGTVLDQVVGVLTARDFERNVEARLPH